MRPEQRDYSSHHNYFDGQLTFSIWDNGSREWRGLVGTPYGYVKVVSYQRADATGITVMSCIVNGRYYMRDRSCFYERTALMGQVKRFINDVATGKCKDIMREAA